MRWLVVWWIMGILDAYFFLKFLSNVVSFSPFPPMSPDPLCTLFWPASPFCGFWMQAESVVCSSGGLWVVWMHHNHVELTILLLQTNCTSATLLSSRSVCALQLPADLTRPCKPKCIQLQLIDMALPIRTIHSSAISMYLCSVVQCSYAVQMYNSVVQCSCALRSLRCSCLRGGWRNGQLQED